MKVRTLIAACVIALAGCASTGGSLATDANILQGTDAAVELAKTVYQAGKLTDAEAQAVIDTANAILGFVQASRSAAAAGDQTTSAAQLRAAADALDALTARLAAKKGK